MALLEDVKATAPDDARSDKFDNRRVFAWNGKNPVKATEMLAIALAEEADLFVSGSGLFWVNDGKQVPVSMVTLRDEIFRNHICHRVPKNTGTEADPIWTVEYHPYEFSMTADLEREPNEMVLRALLGVRMRTDQATMVSLFDVVQRV
jgi:hypothetical protein